MTKKSSSKTRRSKKRKNRDLMMAIAVIAVILVALMLAVAYGSYGYMSKHFPTNELDLYRAQEISTDNSEAVLKSLSKGGKGLEDLMADQVDESEIQALLDFADWENGNYEEKRSFGGGNRSVEANSEGKIEFADMWWVPINGERYMIYIQSVTSRYGRDNDGVCFIAVTTWSHYDAIDWAWDPETDEDTVRVGTPFEVVE